MEPTGPAWLPIAVFFSARGHTVYRVSSAKAHDLRRFLRRHAKSNGIDADTLARLPLVDPAGLHPLQLPDAARAALDRRVRACDRLTQAAATHKRRLKDLVRQLLPASPLVGELGQADLAVLERWADPHALLAAGRARLGRVIAQASNGQQGARRAEQWLTAAKAALELYGDHPAIAFQDLAAEVATEVRLLRATQAELAAHATKREACYQRVDPAALARSLPGLAEDRRPRPGRHHGPSQPLRHRRPGSGPSPAWPQGIRDRPDRPQGPTHHQGRQPAAAHHPDPRRRPRPPPRPPTGPPLLDLRWSNAAKTTSGRSAWSPPTWPSGPGRSWTAACPTSSATPTAPRSPPPKPRPSSPSSGPCQRRSAAGGAARRGRPLNKSTQDMPMALKAQRGDPPLRRPVLAGLPPASSPPCHPVDTQASIGNQTIAGRA